MAVIPNINAKVIKSNVENIYMDNINNIPVAPQKLMLTNIYVMVVPPNISI